VPREILQGDGLCGGESDRAEQRHRRIAHRSGRGEILAVIQRDETREDGVGGTAADLLRRDRPHEVPERRCAGLGAQSVRPRLLDQGGHHRIGTTEVRQQRAPVGRARRAIHFWHAGHQ
jgi:hypothetical protein